MRTLTKLTLSLLALLVIALSSGCGDDGPGLPGGVTLDPTITLNSGADLVSFNQDLDLSTPGFTVSVDMNDGDNPLRDLTIQEDGVNIPASQLNFASGQTSNNPILITGDDTEGAIYIIEITPSNTQVGPVDFTFTVTDDASNTATTSVTINYVLVGPSVEFTIGDELVSGDATVDTRATEFDVELILAGPDDNTDLASITVLEDGVELPGAQVEFDGSSTGNPINFNSTNSTTLPMTITAIDAAGETRLYTFRVEDVNGGITEQSVSIFFDTPPGTALEFDTSGIFFNASGDMSGGLDLDNAEAVSFNSSDAEIQDEGIDLNTTGENWRTQISSVNNAVVRTADLSILGENVDFAAISTQEEIQQLFDAGSQLDGNDNFPDADGDTSSSEEVSQPIIQGDVFAIERDGRFYLVRFDQINFVASSNDDNYMVSIKY